MKLLKFASVLVFFISFITISNSQNVEETKIIVVEKTTDADGNVVTKNIVKTGEEAKEYIKQKKIELGVDGDVKHIKKEIEVEEKIGESSERKMMVIKIKDDEGNEKVLKWDGDGEVPAEMKKYMDDENMGIDVVETEEGKVRVEVMKEGKPRLGVFPENHVDGVEIMDVVKDSAAKKAGLEKGDIIFKIDETTIGSTLQLTEKLKNIESGNEATIHYLRNGVKMTATAKL